MVLQVKRKAVAINKAPAKIDLVPLPLFRLKMPGKKKLDFIPHSWSVADSKLMARRYR